MVRFLHVSALVLCSLGIVSHVAADTGRAINRVFLAGGSGYLGRNLIRHFVAQNVTVHAIARSESAMAVIQSLGAVGFMGDLSDADVLRKAAKGCDIAVHAAAFVKMWGNLDEARAVTVQGTLNVIAAAAAENVGRVVHVGTEAGCIDASGAPLIDLNETIPLPDPPFAGVYSTTKNEAERAALKAGHSTGIEVVVVRPRFIWGRDDTVLLPALSGAANSGVLKWFDGGEYLTSTCHVDNVVEGIEKAAVWGRPGHSYFLTDGAPVGFKPFISRMLLAVGVAPPTASMPLTLLWGLATLAEWGCAVAVCEPFVPRQVLVLMGQQVTVSDAKARNELGYIGHMTIDAGLERLRQEFVENGGIALDIGGAKHGQSEL